MKRPKRVRAPKARKPVNVLHVHYDEVLKESLPGKLKEAARFPGTTTTRDTGRERTAGNPARRKARSKK